MAPLAVLKGHSDWVYCVAIGDVHGRMVLASGSNDKTAQAELMLG